MFDPNADPNTLTVDKLRQTRLGMMLGITLHRRSLTVASQEGTQRCECGNPATLYSTDLLASHGKVVVLCDSCASTVVARAAQQPTPQLGGES